MFFRHWRRQRPSKAVFHADTAIELTGHEQCGSSICVEVEFSACRDTPASFDDPGAAGDRELIGVRVFEHYVKIGTAIIKRRTYLEQPAWLTEIIKDCIDVDQLPVDWSDVEE